MLKGLFLNSPKAQCSIHESGRMIYFALLKSDMFTLDYQEIDAKNREIKDGYDFYAFNYHPFTMPWLDTTAIRNINGFKLTFVLEALPNNPFPMCPPHDFDAYCVLDPTMKIGNNKVYAFPRPLDSFTPVKQIAPSIPTIGTFGFATAGKGFDKVVTAVSKEFDYAIVRINIPTGTHVGVMQEALIAKIEKACYAAANPGIVVQITHDYMTKQELINWCACNTLNCFLYDRSQPGLSATTDQAISSGRPLAVSANETFRHIHKYLTPYPKKSLKESIASSMVEVKQMQEDWSQRAFAREFEKMLDELSVKPVGKTYEISKLSRRNHLSILYNKGMMKLSGLTKPKPVPTKPCDILIVSHKEINCGIHQYGLDITEAMSASRKYLFRYVECSNQRELSNYILQTQPHAILFNYYPATMPWLDYKILSKILVPRLAIMHEVTQQAVDTANDNMFDCWLCPDPTVVNTNPVTFKIPRIVPNYTDVKDMPAIPTIGCFGFGFPDKGFEKIVSVVSSEFDRAKINFNIPHALSAVDKYGKMRAGVIRRCEGIIGERNIELSITQSFFDKQGILDFLAGNTLNAFFYDVDKYKGISSAIDYALAVQRPIAINKCGMFRHIYNAEPSICIEDTTMKRIIENGITPLHQFSSEWTPANFMAKMEKILGGVI